MCEPTATRFRCPPGTKVEARLQADTVELWHEGACVARHERCYSRQQQILDLEHYLDVLPRSPVRWQVLLRWRSGARPDAGPSASIDYGKR